MGNKPTITIYDDFLKDYRRINAWTSSDSFPVEDIETDMRYKDFAVVEITYTGTHGDDSKYGSIRLSFESFLLKYLYSINDKCKLLFNIGEIGIKNRIRSYNGLFKEKTYSIEEEFDLDNGYSIIGGVIRINEENVLLISSYLFDREKCFLIISQDNVFSKDFLIDCFESVINKSLYTVNYVKVCHKYCSNNNIIIRETGDGGDQEFSWQLFVNKKHIDCIKKSIENILEI